MKWSIWAYVELAAAAWPILFYGGSFLNLKGISFRSSSMPTPSNAMCTCAHSSTIWALKLLEINQTSEHFLSAISVGTYCNIFKKDKKYATLQNNSLKIKLYLQDSLNYLKYSNMLMLYHCRVSEWSLIGSFFTKY